MPSRTIISKAGKKIRLTPRQWNGKLMGKIAAERKSKLKHFPTRAERAFREILKSYDLQHGFQKIVYTPNHFYILDFVIQMKPRTIIELDGSAHDGREWYDRTRTEEILKTRTYKHFTVIRIQNDDVFNGKAAQIVMDRYPAFFRRRAARMRRESTHQPAP